MTGLRSPVVALALLISCNAWADLKTFDVDPQYSQEIYAALKEILNSAPPTFGKVQLLPTGQLLVNAPPETLAQVEQVLQAIRARPVAAAPRAELQYWAVFGSRAASANPPGTAPPSALNEVLTELKRMHGDLQFRALGTAALATQSGQRGEVGGTALHVGQTIFVQGETLNAEIELWLQDGPPGAPAKTLTVRTALHRGEFVVLGQSEVFVGDLIGPVFFIVHWPEARAR